MDLRAAYLDLLKPSLTDLLGDETLPAIPHPEGTVKPEPLIDLEKRETGADWPIHGTTMVGLCRLDHFQRCNESIVADEVPGDLIETGVWRGGASIFLRGVLASRDAEHAEFGSPTLSKGCPSRNPSSIPPTLAATSTSPSSTWPCPKIGCGARSNGLLDDSVRFLKGWFSESLPPLRGNHTCASTATCTSRRSSRSTASTQTSRRAASS